MLKQYVLDTNALLQYPECIFDFKENIVVIPIGVLEELDKFKKDHGELGRNARDVCRALDEMRLRGDFSEGIDLNNGFGGKIKVLYGHKIDNFKKESFVDFHVLQVARHLTEIDPENPCIIISKDINVRIRANALGLLAENYESALVKEEIDRGYSIIECEDLDLLTKLDSEEILPVEAFSGIFKDKIYTPNYYFAFQSKDGIKVDGKVGNILAKIAPNGKEVEKLKQMIGGTRVKPKNLEQVFVIDSLLDDRVKLVSIVGFSGSGKTILSVGIGYYLVSKTDRYNKFLVARPVMGVGNKDMGFLPGSLDEKIDPWLKPIYDAFEVLYSSKKMPIDGKEFVKADKNIVIEVLAYIRGRSIHDNYFLIDEAQNTNPLEIKTIITRAGEGTKVVLTGDINQIDNPYMDKHSNGLTVATNGFIGSDLASHIVMNKCVRSRLSEEASLRL